MQKMLAGLCLMAISLTSGCAGGSAPNDVRPAACTVYAAPNRDVIEAALESPAGRKAALARLDAAMEAACR